MTTLAPLTADDREDWVTLWRGYLEFYEEELAQAQTELTFARGSGTGAALIEHVRAWAQGATCSKVYWLTRHDNHTARTLYDRVARHSGFVQYEIDLSGSGADAS